MAYTAEQEAVLVKTAKENGSISFEMAEKLEPVLHKTPRSIVAKVKQLGLPYTPKATAPKRPKGMTKAEMVEAIESALDVGITLDGLEKATGQALGRLLTSIETHDAALD